MSPIRITLAVLVVVVMGGSILGYGMGDAPKSEDAAPTGAALTASKDRIAQGGEKVAEGREEYEEHGCQACHAIAADGHEGVLGPRLDTLAGDPPEEVLENITKPREKIEDGYDGVIMPTDYGKEIGAEELDGIVAYIKAASGSEDEEGEGG